MTPQRRAIRLVNLFERAVRVNAILLATVGGVFTGSLVAGFTIALVWLDDPTTISQQTPISLLLPGYDISIQGAFAGFGWGFLIGSLSARMLYTSYAQLARKRLIRAVVENQISDYFQVDAVTHTGFSARSLGLPLAAILSATLMLSTVLMLAQYDAKAIAHAEFLSYYLPGYRVSFVGGLVGAIEVFALVFLSSQFFCWVYNRDAARQATLSTAPKSKPNPSNNQFASPSNVKLPANNRHVVILGAGPAGLATAHELSTHGVKVTVCERNSYVGGLCRTVEQDGYKFDLGGHRWFTKNEDLNRWFRRLMHGELVEVNRVSRIYYNGKYFKYPVEILDVIKNAGAVTILKAGATYVSASVQTLFRKTPITNMKEAYIAQFGNELYEMFFRRYTEKVWGKPCEELSSDWVSQRSKGLSIWTLLQETLTHEKNRITSLIDSFMYPRDGYMRIPERMAEDVTAAGNEVLLECNVKGVNYLAPNELVVVVNEGGIERRLYATDVVSTIPLNTLLQTTTPAATTEVKQAAHSLRFRDLITVNLRLNRAQVSTDTWLYIQDEDILFGRLHEPKNWSPSMVPAGNHTSLVLECFCTRNDSVWAMEDDAVAARCIEDLADKLSFIDASEVDGWNVVRTTHAYPIYDMTYSAKLKLVNTHFQSMTGLHTVGRGGTFRYNNADHSIESGLLLGQRILGAQIDHMNVNTEVEYHEISTGELLGDRYSSGNRERFGGVIHNVPTIDLSS